MNGGSCRPEWNEGTELVLSGDWGVHGRGLLVERMAALLRGHTSIFRLTKGRSLLIFDLSRAMGGLNAVTGNPRNSLREPWFFRIAA